jgi:hypothetical protein
MGDVQKIVTLEIEGRQFRIAEVGGLTGGRITFRGGQTFAQALTTGFSMKGDPTMAIMSAIVRLMSEQDYLWVAGEMAKVTTLAVYDPANPNRPPTWVPLDIDQHFKGKHMAQLDWLRGALETNFGSFFAELQRRLAEWGEAKAASASPPPTAQTDSGSSGDSSSATG